MIKVFYRNEQSVKPFQSLSPSAYKPKLVVESWKKIAIPIKIVSFQPCDRDSIKRVHDSTYVDGVLDLKLNNGFGNRCPLLRDSLLYNIGSFAGAAIDSFKNKSITISPSSGFHHAHHDHGYGFCTFNGLLVAASLLSEIGAKKIAIIDMDAHHGDGTINIIERLGINYIQHYSFWEQFRQYDDAHRWLEGLRNELLKTISNCDMIFYQAGADCHINDPLGGQLTTSQMRNRDHIIFQIALEQRIPMVWNLAGGYQKNIVNLLQLHNNTIIEHYRAINETKPLSQGA
jgi:acetoin utilization deacetylase AcuC-like enzyme